ncbi:right-handed parallel beta-helix repeat-containing protein [Phytohabitans kaempferiae]|uniref:Right-handed parallel beta-helix repeat-containing protein n=1 Tax=Phytohabitans kaempferiae TaxID=1620943 RepID=A0ABV6LW85_9ACTN
MRRSFRAGCAALVLAGGVVVGFAGPAQAADPTVLYVRQLATACSDSGAGTLEQPFCTIGAAAAVVTSGQTVDVGHGSYRERITVARSGAPGQPITFRATNGATLSGPEAGFVIDGQHDVAIQDIRIVDNVDVPAVDLRNASAITIDGGSISMATNATASAVRLSGVTGSTLRGLAFGGRWLVAGVTMDAATSGVTVSGLTRSAVLNEPVQDAVGIRVDGVGNRVVGNTLAGFTGAGIVVEPTATDTLVVNNNVNNGAGYGIHNRGAARTAITNNSVRERCRDGIRVDGASTGVSVQNNVLFANGLSHANPGVCVGEVGGPEIGVYGTAVHGTVVDYNNTHHAYLPAQAYRWGGTVMGLAAFRSASGQGQHDRDTGVANDVIDSANSSAPGYPAADRAGRARIDDPGVPNTGAGPVTYADRGTVETFRSPVARMAVTLDAAISTVTIDASASAPGTAPIGSYQFILGNGARVTQTSPVLSYRYTSWGDFNVTTIVTGTDGRTGSVATTVSVLRPTSTSGLLSLFRLVYATVRPGNVDIVADEMGLSPAGHFDIVEAGSGQVALFSHATGKYVSAIADADRLYMTRLTVADTERFTLVRNADGSISLRSVATGRYVSLLTESAPFLAAKATTIGVWEKFHQVDIRNAARTLKALVNGKYVSAEGAGTKPLIASRPAANTWEQFDVIEVGNGHIALFARANNRFVAAEGAGTQPLQAKRLAVSTWERFTLIRNPDGTISLKAAVNNRFVAAEGAGTKPLLAGRTAISTWEKFALS